MATITSIDGRLKIIQGKEVGTVCSRIGFWEKESLHLHHLEQALPLQLVVAEAMPSTGKRELYLHFLTGDHHREAKMEESADEV
jgi:hypothetical protein